MLARLNEMAKKDLEDIMLDLSERGLDSVAAKEPYFKIAEVQFFSGDSARMFAGIAEVHYFYLNRNQFYQKRKYRYRSTSNFWDRYDIKLKHYFPPKDSSQNITDSK